MIGVLHKGVSVCVCGGGPFVDRRSGLLAGWLAGFGFSVAKRLRISHAHIEAVMKTTTMMTTMVMIHGIVNLF